MSNELRRRIRTVFLRPVESYDLAEAARLIGVPLARLRRKVERGDRDALKVRGGCAGDAIVKPWRMFEL